MPSGENHRGLATRCNLETLLIYQPSFFSFIYWFVKITKAVLYLENQAAICQTCSGYQLHSDGGKNSFQFAACLFFYFSITHSNLIKMQIWQNQGLKIRHLHAICSIMKFPSNINSRVNLTQDTEKEMMHCETYFNIFKHLI